MNCDSCGIEMKEHEGVVFCPMGCSAVDLDNAKLKPAPFSLTGFLSSFYGENEDLYVFGFSPKELPEDLKETPNRIKTSVAELKVNIELQKRLRLINETQGLYFTVNYGGTKKEDIKRINASFCEIDDLDIQSQHDLYDNAPLPPTIRVETKKSVHAYWLLADDVTIADFHSIQNGLIHHFGSDKALKNENRVMRLPFFNHVSFDLGEYLYKRVEVHTNTRSTFRLEELLSAYPQPKEINYDYVPKQYESRENVWQDLFSEMQNRFRNLPGYHVESGGRLASARGICHNGDTNRTLVMNLKTGVIFCRNECSFDDILTSLGLSRPKKEKPRFTIPKVNAPRQNSELYRALTEV